MAEQDPRPLHVRVAEALKVEVLRINESWRVVDRRMLVNVKVHPEYKRWCVPHEGEDVWAETQDVPRYDTDWCAAGLMIEKYEITLVKEYNDPRWLAYAGYFACADETIWTARTDADTPLLAVCHLILALKEAGKL
jgi:hypothetical protein